MINNNKFDGKIHNVMCMMLKKTRNKTLETLWLYLKNL